MLGLNFLKLFEARKAHLDTRIKRDYIRKGVAVIPCRVSGYDDVISSYSVKGLETLNPEFAEYLKSTAAVTPEESPIVLNIIGDCLSQEEKTTIEEIIRDDMAYDLGMVEEIEKRHTKRLWLMLIILIVTAALLWSSLTMADGPRELLYLLFYFAADILLDHIFLSGHDLREERRLAGRLASIKILFSDNYEDSVYTEKDVNQLYSEIEKDVNETIHGSEP